MARALSDGLKIAETGRWSDFWVRLASAVILGPLALISLWYGQWAWSLLIFIALFGLGAEWTRLAGGVGRRAEAFLLPAGLVVVAAVSLTLGPWSGCFALLALALFVWHRAGWFTALGVPYAGIGGLCLLWLRLDTPDGLMATLFLVVVIWATDIGAYLVGRWVGGARLAPRISPGKTWSGSIGGLLIAGMAGAVLAGRGHGIDWWALAPALGLSFFAQAGDLMESAIKRRLGVKDSGRTIPGHGGLFDRLDGFLAAAPIAALLALGAHGGLPLWR